MHSTSGGPGWCQGVQSMGQIGELKIGLDIRFGLIVDKFRFVRLVDWKLVPSAWLIRSAKK